MQPRGKAGDPVCLGVSCRGAAGGQGGHTFLLALGHPDVEVQAVFGPVGVILGDGGLQASFLEGLGLQGPWSDQRGWREGGGPSTPPPAAGPAQHPPAPTLPARVWLGVLQGLGGSGKGDALEDVDIVAQQAQLLVDTFHEASFRVHHAQLQERRRAQRARARQPRGPPERAPGPGASFKERPVCT